MHICDAFSVWNLYVPLVVVCAPSRIKAICETGLQRTQFQFNCVIFIIQLVNCELKSRTIRTRSQIKRFVRPVLAFNGIAQCRTCGIVYLRVKRRMLGPKRIKNVPLTLTSVIRRQMLDSKVAQRSFTHYFPWETHFVWVFWLKREEMFNNISSFCNDKWEINCSMTVSWNSSTSAKHPIREALFDRWKPRNISITSLHRRRNIHRSSRWHVNG